MGVGLDGDTEELRDVALPEALLRVVLGVAQLLLHREGPLRDVAHDFGQQGVSRSLDALYQRGQPFVLTHELRVLPIQREVDSERRQLPRDLA